MEIGQSSRCCFRSNFLQRSQVTVRYTFVRFRFLFQCSAFSFEHNIRSFRDFWHNWTQSESVCNPLFVRIKCVSNCTIVRSRWRRNRHPTIFLCPNSIWLRVKTRYKFVGLLFIYDGSRSCGELFYFVLLVICRFAICSFCLAHSSTEFGLWVGLRWCTYVEILCTLRNFYTHANLTGFSYLFFFITFGTPSEDNSMSNTGIAAFAKVDFLILTGKLEF